ncbi:hypothetical protein BC829DRAFT_297215 [Chytridium lagenaria]|nr:hypothetical protein BC829DRAFT_297215 [Chytridium lagenaria]
MSLRHKISRQARSRKSPPGRSLKPRPHSSRIHQPTPRPSHRSPILPLPALIAKPGILFIRERGSRQSLIISMMVRVMNTPQTLCRQHPVRRLTPAQLHLNKGRANENQWMERNQPSSSFQAHRPSPASQTLHQKNSAIFLPHFRSSRCFQPSHRHSPPYLMSLTVDVHPSPQVDVKLASHNPQTPVPWATTL